ncbi:MAG: DUF4199 domain-containing protein [Edaphocola sp.]
MSSEKSGIGLGLQYGVATGFVYLALLLLRYLVFGANVPAFNALKFISYFILAGMFVVTILARRKQLGGYADAKQLFQPVFMVVLVAEITYSLFSCIYLNFIDPGFMDGFMERTVEYLKNNGAPLEIVNQQIALAKEQAAVKAAPSGYLQGLATWIVLDSILALLLCIFLKKNKPAHLPGS